MPNVNLVVLLGHLGHDLELRFTPKSTPVLNFRMATTKRWKDQVGVKQERTEWHRVVTFGPTAEFLKEYAKKGALVHVEGSLQTRDWSDKEGTKRYTTEIVASRIQMLGRSDDRVAQTPIDEPTAPTPPVEPEGDDDIPF